MTAAKLQPLAESFDTFDAAYSVVDSRIRVPFALEALGTFCLLTTVGVATCTAGPFAALGIGAVLMVLIYAGSLGAGAHFNPAITLAALLWGRISLRDAAGYWCAQLAAGLCAALSWHVIVGPGRMETATSMMLGGRILIAALAAELLLTFALSCVVLSCVMAGRDVSNLVSDLAIGVAVTAGAVDVGAVLGGVYMVSQVIVGAIAAIAFLTFGSAGLR
jgi:aquaporin Z